MGKDRTYPSELVVNTRKANGTWLWDVRDENGRIYECSEAEEIWFAACEDDVYIDHNLTFARLVERNFQADLFNRYLNER